MRLRDRLATGFLLSFFLLFVAPYALAQFTNVTGTVIDSTGVPYDCGTLSATIVNANGQQLYLNGQLYSAAPSPVPLGCALKGQVSGSFLLSVGDNTQIKCGNPSTGAIVTCATQTQWTFQAAIAPGILPPSGTGPQFCNTAALTISGASQSITSSLNACPPLSKVGLPLSASGTQLLAPPGSLSAPSYSFSANTNVGMYSTTSSFLGFSVGSNGGTFSFSQPNTVACTIIIGGAFVCGTSPGTTALGSTGAPFSSVFGQAFISKGTTFTSNAGCSETTLLGGATAGSFHTGTASTCTIIVTMGNSQTATNGWSCSLWDTTTTATVLKQTAFSTTTASFTLTTPGNGDVIIFACEGF